VRTAGRRETLAAAAGVRSARAGEASPAGSFNGPQSYFTPLGSNHVARVSCRQLDPPQDLGDQPLRRRVAPTLGIAVSGTARGARSRP
jgi:hypothetical protein